MKSQRRIKKRYIVVGFILLFLIVGLSYNSFIKDEMKEEVITYINNNGEYKNKKIKEISISHAKFGLTASVIFKKEPDKSYFFTYDDSYANGDEIDPAGASK